MSWNINYKREKNCRVQRKECYKKKEQKMQTLGNRNELEVFKETNFRYALSDSEPG